MKFNLQPEYQSLYVKKLTLLFAMLILVQFVFGQDKSNNKDSILFEKGYLLQTLVKEDLDLDEIINSQDNNITNKELATDIKETILHKSLENYKELIKKFPKSRLLFRALNNKGFIELSLNNNDEAKKTFQRILDSNADDNENLGAGSGIMAEPYANYKNRASKILAELYINDDKYIEAINYLNLTQKYPYKHFGGNELAADRIRISELYAKCYIGLNDRKKALEYLLPNIMDNGLADNSKLVILAYETMLKEYSRTDLKITYEQAFKTYKREKVKNTEEVYYNYFIKFLNVQIKLSPWRLSEIEPQRAKDEINNIYTQSQLYKLLHE